VLFLSLQVIGWLLRREPEGAGPLSPASNRGYATQYRFVGSGFRKGRGEEPFLFNPVSSCFLIGGKVRHLYFLLWSREVGCFAGIVLFIILGQTYPEECMTQSAH